MPMPAAAPTAPTPSTQRGSPSSAWVAIVAAIVGGLIVLGGAAAIVAWLVMRAPSTPVAVGAPATSSAAAGAAGCPASGGPRVFVGVTQITYGPLPTERAQGVAEQHIDELRACLAQALAHEPGLHGELSIALRVEAAGAPSYVAAQDFCYSGSCAKNVELRSCAQHVVTGWKFPAQSSWTNVLYMFELCP
jgi:hypothetical protein